MRKQGTAESLRLAARKYEYDRYALKAFEVSALDYLLKPFSDERFERSLARVLSFVRPHSHGDFLVVLRDGTELKLSRSFRQKVEANLGQSL